MKIAEFREIGKKIKHAGKGGNEENRGEVYKREREITEAVWVSRRTISSRKPKGRSLANCRRLHARCTPVTFVYRE